MNSILKIVNMQHQIMNRVVQRHEVVEALMVAAIAGEHVFLYGPAGVGKSMTLKLFAESFADETTYFEILMTMFTMPEEIWGPLSTQGLKEDRYRRNLKGRLAEAEICFLDEIYKSNSAILNSLLKALNERYFDDDGISKKIPLRTCVAASNEVPNDDSGLEALADRLVLRLVVNPVEGDAARDAVTWRTFEHKEFTDKLSWSDFEEARAHAYSLDISREAIDGMRSIVDDIRQAKIVISDRRIQKAAKIVRCYAALTGNTSVQSSDLNIVRNIFWNKPSEAPIVAEIVDKHCASWLKDIREINNKIAEISAALEKTKLKPKMEKMLDCTRLLNQAEESITSEIDKVRYQIDNIKNKKADEAFIAVLEAQASLKNDITATIKGAIR